MIVRRRLGSAKRSLVRRVAAPLALAAETAQALRARARIASFKARVQVARRFPESVAQRTQPSVLAVVTHVADPTRPLEASADRLERTLEGLLESLGHARLELVLNTVRGGHAAAALPEHLRERLVIREHEIEDPMFLGFEAQGEFVRCADSADWFLYLEDDLVLGDSFLLEKLAYFNAGAPPEALLLPHRYEFWRGRKVYIDLLSRRTVDWAWNRLTMLDVGEWKFAEFDNPHSGTYCLSRAQLRRWLDSGRHWYGRVSFGAPRESAATGCLGESFRLYKPHPSNTTYLEIRHLGSKYAERLGQIHGPERLWRNAGPA
jgi:hypothetical protein